MLALSATINRSWLWIPREFSLWRCFQNLIFVREENLFLWHIHHASRLVNEWKVSAAKLWSNLKKGVQRVHETFVEKPREFYTHWAIPKTGSHSTLTDHVSLFFTILPNTVFYFSYSYWRKKSNKMFLNPSFILPYL